MTSGLQSSSFNDTKTQLQLHQHYCHRLNYIEVSTPVGVGVLTDQWLQQK